MLAAVVALALSQSPRCIDKGDERACGYTCVENAREARCAHTRAGVCGKGTRSLRCFDPPPDATRPPSCLTAGPEVDCGYDCKKNARGDVLCARTEAGVCAAGPRSVECFDPPPEATAKPSCLVDGASVACGFDCKAAKGQVACARTALGVCATNGSTAVCFDPWPDTTSKPACVVDGAAVACGFDCKAKNGKAACARSSDGVCGVSTTSVSCFDPFEPSTKKPTCVADGAALACGYDCVSKGGHVACAHSLRGVCAASSGDVACFDPPTDAPADRVPTCLVEGAEVACGYDCVRAGGHVACAQTVDGVCSTNGVAVACFDPSVHGLSPRPTCEPSGDSLTCGYDCTRAGAQVGCARTPKGKCVAQDGGVFCFDPPLVVYALRSREVPDPTCVSGITCGFSCSSGDAGVACAKTPFGVCAENGSSCFDPGLDLLCSALGSLTPPSCVVPRSGVAACGYNCAVVGAKAACARTPAGRCAGLVCSDPPVKRVHSWCVERALGR